MKKSSKIIRNPENPGIKHQPAKPFLKWAGGKGQLLKKFQDLYPTVLREKKVINFYEPFLGSGAVFLDIVQNYPIKHAFLYDINDDLVLTWKVVQQHPDNLIEFLYRYQLAYQKLTLPKKKEYYLTQRATYNKTRLAFDYKKINDRWIQRAAQFIFLNRTCFNGLYRVNSIGEFNVPAGDYKKPTICDEENIRAVSKLLQIATIKKADYKLVQKDLKPASFVYLDPPYRPLTKTAGFTAYSKTVFTDKEQIELAAFFSELNKKNCYLMLSNSDPKNQDPADQFFDNLYSEFYISRIPARRIINSDASKRGSINEIIVRNYK